MLSSQNCYHMLAQWWMKVSILSSRYLRKIMYKQQAYSKSLQKFLVTCCCFSSFPLSVQFPCNPLAELKINKSFQGLCDFQNLKDHCLQKRDLVQFRNVKLIVKVAEKTGNLHFILPDSSLFLIFLSTENRAHWLLQLMF